MGKELIAQKEGKNPEQLMNTVRLSGQEEPPAQQPEQSSETPQELHLCGAATPNLSIQHPKFPPGPWTALSPSSASTPQMDLQTKLPSATTPHKSTGDVRHQGQELTPSEVAGLEETQHRLLKTKKCWFSAIIERFGFSLQAADLSLKLLLACATQRGTLCCQRHSIPVIKSDKKRERKKKNFFEPKETFPGDLCHFVT